MGYHSSFGVTCSKSEMKRKILRVANWKALALEEAKFSFVLETQQYC